MKKVLIIVLLSTWGMTLSAQEVASRKDTVRQEHIFSDPEMQAFFPGGPAALRRYLEENLQWPDVESCVQGRVTVSFMVERDGTISDVKVVRSLDPAFDEEALRLVKNMPRWNPASLNGERIRQRFYLPIPFIIK